MRDTFEFSPDRDSESTRVVTGFDLGDQALIAGRGRIGYRQYTNVSGAVQDFTGLVASYGVAMTLAGRTRIEIAGQRDVNHSYELAYPYYVLTGATVTGTPRLTNNWDIQGRLGLQRLAYRAADSVPGALSARTDNFRLFGGGIGYHLGREVRLGVNVDRQRRTSPLHLRDYDGYRIGTSITYGR
jgi:hypothetical protein